MSSYWDIRKSRALDYLPPPPPVPDRGGIKDNDQQLLRSRAWMQRYHEEKAKEKANAKAKQDAKRQHVDATGPQGEDQSGSEAPAR